MKFREKHIPDHWTSFNTKCLLGACLAGQSQHAEGEKLLLEGYKGMKDREKDIPPQGKVRLSEAIEYIVKLYEDWEKPEEAAKWRKLLPLPRSPLIHSDPRGPAGGCWK